MRKIVLIITVLAALVVGALPAQAGGKVSWTDKEGDAGSFVSTAASPLPSDASLDIVKVEASSDGKALSFSMKVKQMSAGYPPGAPGVMYRFSFLHDGVTWNFRIADHQGLGASTGFRASDNTAQVDLKCDKCEGAIDRKTHTVYVKAPIASVNTAMKEWKAAVTPMKAGDKLGGLGALSQRFYVRLSASADDAPAPKELELSV